MGNERVRKGSHTDWIESVNSLSATGALDVQIMMLQQHGNYDSEPAPPPYFYWLSSLRNHQGFRRIHIIKNQRSDPK